MKNLPLIELLYNALNSPLGLIVESPDPRALMQKLYALRKDDPALSLISLSISKVNPNNLLILRRPDEDDAPTPPD